MKICDMVETFERYMRVVDIDISIKLHTNDSTHKVGENHKQRNVDRLWD